MAEKLPALQETVDTDGLNILFREGPRLTVSFTYADYSVERMDETVSISKPAFSIT